MPFSVRTAEDVQLTVIGQIDPAKVPTDKPKFILAVVKENGEPTVHALRQLEGDPDAVIVRPGDPTYDACKAMIEAGCGADPKSLPFVVVADASGKVYYLSQGYNTTLRDRIDKVFPKIQ